jgi:acyl-CoA reductase-like NAD-dependent aldehyde dehydrogenase
MLLKDRKRPGFIQCYDPSTLQKLGEVKAMTAADVEEIVAKAAAAQLQWAKTSFAERRRVLRCVQAYILAHQDDICRVASRDSGKPSEFVAFALAFVIIVSVLQGVHSHSNCKLTFITIICTRGYANS